MLLSITTIHSWQSGVLGEFKLLRMADNRHKLFPCVKWRQAPVAYKDREKLWASLNLSRFAASCGWAGNKTEHKATVHAWSMPAAHSRQPCSHMLHLPQLLSRYLCVLRGTSQEGRSHRSKLSVYIIAQEGRFRTTTDDNLPRGGASAVPESLQQQQ